jgi:hypothetical protein
LGNGKGGCAAIKKHRFFSGFGWEDLYSMNREKLKPPIDVKVKSDSDASNFDKYDEEAEIAPICKDWKPAEIPFVVPVAATTTSAADSSVSLKSAAATAVVVPPV